MTWRPTGRRGAQEQKASVFLHHNSNAACRRCMRRLLARRETAQKAHHTRSSRNCSLNNTNRSRWRHAAERIRFRPSYPPSSRHLMRRSIRRLQQQKCEVSKGLVVTASNGTHQRREREWGAEDQRLRENAITNNVFLSFGIRQVTCISIPR